jgi:hypothetical protein
MEVHLHNTYGTKLFKCYFKTPFLLPREITAFPLKISWLTNICACSVGQIITKNTEEFKDNQLFFKVNV